MRQLRHTASSIEAVQARTSKGTAAVKLSRRLDAIAPFQVMAILEKARALQAAGHDVIHLEIGEPDFATPQAIVDAGRAALAAGHTFYPHKPGLPVLRDTIARNGRAAVLAKYERSAVQRTIRGLLVERLN